MGREIRRVPPNWKHPINEPCPHFTCCAYGPDKVCYQPLYDESYDDAAKAWMKGLSEFKPNHDAGYFWDWDGMPPKKDFYRPDWKPEEATWYQVYETVSEGTPVSPPFATKVELVNYLCTYGDYWDQRRGSGPWSRENAERFVELEWQPTAILMVPR